MSLKNSNDNIGNRTRDLLVEEAGIDVICGATLQLPGRTKEND
jgi:hypothetical protein